MCSMMAGTNEGHDRGRTYMDQWRMDQWRYTDGDQDRRA